MNIHRIWAMVIRYWINTRYSYDRMTDLFYWPAMDLFLWGLTGLYFAKFSNSPHFIQIVLSGLVFWIVIWRAQYEITINLLTEIWDQNIVNIFIAPLKVGEWAVSFMIFGILKMLISVAFSALLAFVLYKFNSLTYGFTLIPIILSLTITGWAIGFFVSGFLIRYGQKIQTVGWMGVVLIAPFSALYYPVSVLPQWAQKIAAFVPSSYIFEAMREILFTGKVSYDKIVISFALNIVYLILALWFFVYMFKKTRKAGIGSLI